MVKLYFDSIFGYLLFVGHIVIWIMILTGNTLTILAVWRYRNLQSKTNILVASLSCADILVGVFSIIFDSSRIFNLTDTNPEKKEFILLYQLGSASYVCSLIHLVAIATDRYICIMYPLRYESLMSDVRLKIVTVCLWLIPYISSMLPIPLEINGILDIVDVGILYVPLHIIEAAVICFIYIRIYRESKKQAFLINQQISSVSESVKKDTKRKQKSARILGLLILAYIITWVPIMALYASHSVLDQKALSTQIMYEVCNLLLLSNSAINIYIYAWKNSKFRHAYLQLLKCYSVNSVHVASSQEPQDTETRA